MKTFEYISLVFGIVATLTAFMLPQLLTNEDSFRTMLQSVTQLFLGIAAIAFAIRNKE